jgi:hypothetical protein
MPSTKDTNLLSERVVHGTVRDAFGFPSQEMIAIVPLSGVGEIGLNTNTKVIESDEKGNWQFSVAAGGEAEFLINIGDVFTRIRVPGNVGKYAYTSLIQE